LDGFKEITKYTGHSKPINALSFQDVTSFVSVSNQIVIHDVSKTEPIRRIYSESRFSITDVKPLNADILAICEDRAIKLFDMRQRTSYKPIQEFSDARDSLNTLDYDTGRFRLYSGGNDGVLLTYDLRQGLLVKDPLNDCITDMCIHKGDLVLNTFGGVKTVSDKGLTKDTWHKEPDDKEYRIDIQRFEEGIITGSEHGHLYHWDEKVTKYKLCDSVISAIDATDLIYCGDNNGCVHTIRF
jgi:WD40 repeat protein